MTSTPFILAHINRVHVSFHIHDTKSLEMQLIHKYTNSSLFSLLINHLHILIQITKVLLPLSKGLFWKPSIFSDRSWDWCSWQTGSEKGSGRIPRQADCIESHKRLIVQLVEIAEAKPQHPDNSKCLHLLYLEMITKR